MRLRRIPGAVRAENGTISTQAHWEKVYSEKTPQQVSWYQAEAQPSLRLIQALGLSPDAAIIDVGAGASILVDELLAAGYHRLSVLDLSERALASARQRLGQRAGRVEWLQADITSAALPHAAFDLWHDRAVLHFLTEPAERDAYVAQARKAIRPGGHLLLASFSPEGPQQCSGLPVARYSADSIAELFAADFELLEHENHEHRTPGGYSQAFVYCHLRRQR